MKTTLRSHNVLGFFAEAANDVNGNRTQRSDNLLSTTFTYDNLERLDTALGIFGARDYTLDKNGNRTQLQIGATTTTYSYRPASRAMGSGLALLHDILPTHWLIEKSSRYFLITPPPSQTRSCVSWAAQAGSSIHG